MQVSLIDIGTSKGVRIPSVILKDFDTPNIFELSVQGHKIILDVIKNPREGWTQKFKDRENDLLIDDALDLEQWSEI